MELSISSHGSTTPSILEEGRKEVRRNDNNAKVNLKDPMIVNTIEVNIPRRGANANEKRLEGWQKNEVRRLTFKEPEQKVYPFPDEDVPNILEQLLQLNCSQKTWGKLMTLTTASIIASLATRSKNALSSKNKS